MLQDRVLRLVPRIPALDASTSGFLQSGLWAGFKGRFGWTSYAFDCHAEGWGGALPEVFGLSVLLRRLGGPLSFAYVPGGPDLDCPESLRSDLLLVLSRSLRAFLPVSCLFLRFDSPWYHEESLSPAAPARLPLARPRFERPLRKAGSDVQPPDSVLLDLGPSPEALLAAMKPKWRYNVRLAEKKGVIVTNEGKESLSVFYGLYEQTARRDRIAIHPRSYYEALFDAVAAFPGEGREGTGAPRLGLWIARHEGRALAAIITLFYGRQASYLYGASSDEGRSLMPAYALQWAAIRAARAADCSQYDFYGIPPVDDPEHPMAGLYRFKTGFGGTVVHYAGSWDFAFSRPLYALFRFFEGLRAFWFKVVRKRLL
ncbi:MAG: peptidoglycan bridge formation glycyltransferase FemA/FemB family protein [Spirochaetota bacterium]